MTKLIAGQKNVLLTKLPTKYAEGAKTSGAYKPETKEQKPLVVKRKTYGLIF